MANDGRSNSSNDDIDSRQSALNALVLGESSPDYHLLLVNSMRADCPFDEPWMLHDLVNRESLGPIRMPHSVEQATKLGTEVFVRLVAVGCHSLPEKVSMALTDQLIVRIVCLGGQLPGVLPGLEGVEDHPE